jgi:hypothetical protein
VSARDHSRNIVDIEIFRLRSYPACDTWGDGVVANFLTRLVGFPPGLVRVKRYVNFGRGTPKLKIRIAEIASTVLRDRTGLRQCTTRPLSVLRHDSRHFASIRDRGSTRALFPGPLTSPQPRVFVRERKRIFQRSAGMICPQCSKTMKPVSRMFLCEPCRQIVIIFTITQTFKPSLPQVSSLSERCVKRARHHSRARKIGR